MLVLLPGPWSKRSRGTGWQCGSGGGGTNDPEPRHEARMPSPAARQGPAEALDTSHGVHAPVPLTAPVFRREEPFVPLPAQPRGRQWTREPADRRPGRGANTQSKNSCARRHASLMDEQRNTHLSRNKRCSRSAAKDHLIGHTTRHPEHHRRKQSWARHGQQHRCRQRQDPGQRSPDLPGHL
jgi:hypothetical protein